MEGAVTRALLFDEDDVEGMVGGLPPVLSTDSTRGFDSPSLPVWERMGLWMMAAPTSVMYGWKHEALVKGEIPHADAGVAEPTNCPLKTSMSRMPHPRDHNGPQMLVMREESSSINECGGSSCVYEVQVHEPTGGFGCSWFVEDVVVPSHRLRHAYGGAVGSPEPRAVRAALLAFPESPSASTEKAPSLQVHPFLVATPLDGSYLVLGALMERYYPHAVRAGDDSSLTVEAPSPATKEKLDEALEAAVESLQRHSGSCRIPERFVPAEQLLIPLAPLTTTVAEEEAEVEEEEDDLLAAYRRSGSNGATSSLEHLPHHHHHHDDGVGESNRYAPWLNHRHLRRLCLVQTTADGAHYYQFSLVKAVRWVAGRVRRVARHPVLGELLGLPGRSGAVEEEAPRLRAALDLIAAYVSPLLLDLAALYLGVPNSKVKATVPPTAPHTSSMVSSTARGLPACPKQASAVQGTASDERRGPVSASVRRLEKSGRPKNTPTLFSLFAKKSPATKEDE